MKPKVGPAVVPNERDYGAASMRKAERKEKSVDKTPGPVGPAPEGNIG
jgi:hypothetical protein